MIRILTLCVVSLVAGTAHGNGATASFAAGGLTFRDSTDISIASEDLYLSPYEIRVDYVFHSSAGEPLVETIAFPMPRVPSDLESSVIMSSVLDPDGASGDMRNYLDFGVAVNDRPIIPVLHEFAWAGDEPVTETILGAGLPLLPRYDAWQELAGQLQPDTLAALVEKGLVIDLGSYTEPAWDYQAVYEWQQAFAPGETRVSIHYRPLLGWPGDYGVDEFDQGERAQAACVDDALREAIAEHKRSNSYYEVAQLDYITTTARHWSGPIGEFNLTVGPTEAAQAAGNGPILSAVCPAGTLMDEDGIRRWSASDHVPQQDIHVTFYFFY